MYLDCLICAEMTCSMDVMPEPPDFMTRMVARLAVYDARMISTYRGTSLIRKRPPP